MGADAAHPGPVPGDSEALSRSSWCEALGVSAYTSENVQHTMPLECTYCVLVAVGTFRGE